MTTDAEYQEWLGDQSRNSHRVLIVEMDHADGTVSIASKAWISTGNEIYDDSIYQGPYLERTLNNMATIGDLRAIDQGGEGWGNYHWYGHECRWYHGDKDWSRQDFRQIASARVIECMPQGGNLYQFNLLSSSSVLNSSYADADETVTLTVQEALAWLIDNSGVTVTVDIDDEDRLLWPVEFDVDESTTILDTLTGLARSINASMRSDNIGNIELVSTDRTSVLTVTENDTLRDELQVSEVSNPYTGVEVVLSDGTSISESTGVDANGLSRVHTVETYLTGTGSDVVLSEQASYHANPRRLWTVPVYSMPAGISEGDTVTIDTPECSGVGHIETFIMSPLSTTSTLEVRL